METKKLMPVVALAAAAAATSCASNDWTLSPCEAAAVHLTECSGRPATVPADCEDQDAELVLEVSCEQLGLGVKGFLDDLIDAFFDEDEDENGYEDGYEDEEDGSWDDDTYGDRDGDEGAGGVGPEGEYEEYSDCMDDARSTRCCGILYGNADYVGDSDGGSCCGLDDYYGCGSDIDCCPGLVCIDDVCTAEPSDDWHWE